jgi:hypothetical protein
MLGSGIGGRHEIFPSGLGSKLTIFLHLGRHKGMQPEAEQRF